MYKLRNEKGEARKPSMRLQMRVISFMLVFLIVFGSLPIESFADVIGSEQQNEALLKEKLRTAVDETKYPNGMFEFLATKMNTSEDLSSVEFAIVRKGGTAGKASVTFKAIDVTAKYGEDYTISVPQGLFTQPLPANEAAKPLIDSFNNVETTTAGAVYTDAGEAGQGISETDEVYSNSGTEYFELPASQSTTNGGLRVARDAFTGKTSERRTWREADQVTKNAALDLNKEIYEDVPGVTYTFNFEDGEYIKKIKFNTIDDSVSEDEEQVLLALTNSEGGVIGEYSSGFMNIEDNEEKEKVEFEIAEEQISVDRLAGYAEVMVRRTAGLYRYGMIDVGTAALTAQPEVDYEPVSTQLRFVPGQYSQKVKVPLLEGETGDELQFLIKLDPASPNLSSSGKTKTVVTIKAAPVYLMQAKAGNAQIMSESQQLSSSTDSITYNGINYKEIKTLTIKDITAGSYQNENGWAKMTHNVSGSRKDESISFKEDLSNVDLVKFQWYADSTPVNKVIPTKTTNRSTAAMYMGSFIGAFRPGDFSTPWETVVLGSEHKKQNELKFRLDFTKSGRNAKLHIGEVKLYCKTYNFVLRDLDSNTDADITPKVWTSAKSSESGLLQHIGSLAFADDNNATTKKYGIVDTISLVPKFTNNNIDTSKVYLWGYKIEKKGGNSNGDYYRVEGDKLDVQKLLAGTLKDSEGNIIKPNDILMADDKIAILPIFYAKNAYVKVYFDSTKGGMDSNTFSNGELIKVGMLDTIKFKAYALKGSAVSGYAGVQHHGLISWTFFGASPVYYDENSIPTYDDERGRQKYTSKEDETLISEFMDAILSNLDPRGPYQINNIGINPALPGELEFKPQKYYSKLTVQYGTPSLKVKVNPTMTNQDGKGRIAYIPGEGTAKEGNSNEPLVISPIERNKTYTLSGSPVEGYRMVWQDWSGDLNENGRLEERELRNLGDYKKLFERHAVVGNFYNYIPNYDRPLIYYFFEPKPTGNPETVSGKVLLKGKDILKTKLNEDKGIAGVVVNVNGHSIATDKDGNFEIQDSDFVAAENHSLTINYKGISYTGQILVNCFTDIVINEYDTFEPYDFTVSDSTGAIIKPEVIDNRDAEYTFSFYVTPLKQGISAEKAVVRIYSREGTQKGTGIEVLPHDGEFEFDFNPAANNVVNGDSMTLQFVDQNGVTYMEHNVGFVFQKKLNTFSLLSSFESPAKPAIDMLGNVDAAFDLGLAGKADKYINKSNSKEWTISFGFNKDWTKSSSGDDDAKPSEDEIEEMKDAASDDASEAELKATAEKAVDKKNEEKKSASVTTDMEFGISTALYLRMIINEDETDENYKQAYFKEMIMTATLSGSYKKKVERMTPIGVTVFVELELGGSIAGMLVVDQYGDNKAYFDGNGKINFSNAKRDDLDREFTIYGNLIVQPSIKISVGAEIASVGARLEIKGEANFNLNFTTTDSGSGDVTLSCSTTLRLLFFSYEWEIAQKKWNLFSNGANSLNVNSFFDDVSYLYENAEDYNVISRQYLDNRGGWQEGVNKLMAGSLALDSTPYNEQTLETGVYPDPYTLLATIGDNQQLLVFLDDDATSDEKNRTHLYYSIYDGTSWSMPQKVDNDNTPDGLPWISDMGDKVLVAWSSAASAYGGEETAMKALNNRNIKARFFDKAGKTFDEVQEVTHETKQDTYSDSEPYIAYCKDETGKENLMIVYTKTEYKETGGFQ